MGLLSTPNLSNSPVQINSPITINTDIKGNDKLTIRQQTNDPFALYNMNKPKIHWGMKLLSIIGPIVLGLFALNFLMTFLQQS